VFKVAAIADAGHEGIGGERTHASELAHATAAFVAMGMCFNALITHPQAHLDLLPMLAQNSALRGVLALEDSTNARRSDVRFAKTTPPASRPRIRFVTFRFSSL
jgi:hypothetical protein